MARRVGVRVLKFSLGFGPRLVGFTRGDTEYVISAVPLGGYVKMAGENPDDPRSGRDDEFLSKSKWERFQILIMGPLMNLFLAVVVLAGVLMNGAEIPAYQSKPPVVGHVTADTPAARAGIQRGDRIVTVAGRDVNTWEQFIIAIGTRAGSETEIGVLRDGKQFSVRVTPAPQTRFEIGEIGVLPDTHPTVSVAAGGRSGRKGGAQTRGRHLARGRRDDERARALDCRRVDEGEHAGRDGRHAERRADGCDGRSRTEYGTMPFARVGGGMHRHQHRRGSHPDKARDRSTPSP